jgi:hypothetical protein
MSQKDELFSLLSEAKSSRRKVLAKAAAGTAAVAASLILPGCGGSHDNNNNNGNGSGGGGTTSAPTALDVLNFALNLEYLEAEYYSLGVYGTPIDNAITGNPGNTVAGDVFPHSPKVSFSNYGAALTEIANDEIAHVKFLRDNLGKAAVPRPPIDLVNSFNAAAKAAGIGPSFNPFLNEIYFALGAFVFEDVGVTAYHGGAPYLNNTPYLSAAAGILGTEAYHAGALREIVLSVGGTVLQYANQISKLRATADLAAASGDATDTSGHEEAPGSPSSPVISPSDSNSIAFSRTPQEVLKIVYLNTKPYGGFFPKGLSGRIR